MKLTAKRYTLFILSLFLVACDSDSQKMHSDTSAEQPAHKTFIPQHQLDALQKAKGVEDTIIQATRRRDEAMPE